MTLMAAAIVAAYLLGSIPFALILARRWSAVDLRRVGSGNLGAANVMRTSGIAALSSTAAALPLRACLDGAPLCP